MNVKYIRQVAKDLEDDKYDYTSVEPPKEGKRMELKKIQTFKFPTCVSLYSKLLSGQDFKLEADELAFIKDVTPDDSFSDYVHYRGNFYFIDPNCKTATFTNPENIDFDKIKVFDFSHASFDSLWKSVRRAYELVVDALDEFDKSARYDPIHYSIVKEIQHEVSEKYDPNYSITREQVDAMTKWKNAHYKEYHKNYSKQYHGASPMSIFKVQFEACSLGDWADCVCTECMKAADAETNEKKQKRLRERGRFEIFNNL